MALIPTGVVNDLRRTLNQTLPDIATITRTGVEVACRVGDDKREERLSGLPTFIRLRRWRIVMPDGQDVRGGDTITVPGKGLYFVIDTGSPTSYSVSTAAYCVMMRDAAGAVAFPTNTTVRFDNPTANLTLPAVPALVYPAAHDAEITPVALRYEWAVWIDPLTVYPATTTKVQTGDLLTWTHLVRPVPVSEPRPIISPIEASCFYAKVVSDGQR